METTNHLSSTLQWCQGKYKRTITLSKHNNVATFWLAPGYRQFEAYEATAGFHKATDSKPFIAEEVHIIQDDDTSYRKTTNPWNTPTKQDQPRKVNMDITQDMVNP